MNRQYQIRIDIYNMLLRFLIIFTVTGMITMLFTRDTMYFWKTLILFQASILSFLIGRFSKHIWSYLLLHLLLTAGYLMLTQDFILRIIYVTYIVCFALIQFSLDLKSKIRNTPIAFVGVFILMYLLCEFFFQETQLLSKFFFALAVIYGVIYILNRHLINFYIYLIKFEEMANVPFKQIRVSNGIFITIFVVFNLIVMMLSTRFPIGGVLRYVGIALRNLLRAVISLLTNQPEPEEAEVPAVEQEQPAEDMLLDLPPQEPSQFWLVLSKIVMVVSLVAFVVLVITLVIYGLYKIYKAYYQRTGYVSTEEKIEVISPFEKVNLSFFGGRREQRKGIFRLFGKTNNERIRQHYQKAILKNNAAETELCYQVPRELSKYAVLKEGMQTDQRKISEKEELLTTLYEKARYSNTDCSKEELQTVKNLLK